MPSCFLAAVALAQPALAQIGPYSGRGSAYHGWGAHSYGYNSTYNTQARIAAQRQAQSQSRAMSQNRVVQQGIRSTLSSQARAQSQRAINQQQGAKDMWFQQRQRQLAESKTPARYRPAPVASGVPSASFTPATATLQPTEPQPSTEIIKWLPLLKDPRFAKQRARVEAPYLERAAGRGDVTVAEYREMIDATVQMKTILKQMANEISAADYLAAEKFLDTLAAEASQRAEKKAASPPTPEPAEEPGTPSKAGE